MVYSVPSDEDELYLKLFLDSSFILNNEGDTICCLDAIWQYTPLACSDGSFAGSIVGGTVVSY